MFGFWVSFPPFHFRSHHFTFALWLSIPESRSLSVSLWVSLAVLVWLTGCPAFVLSGLHGLAFLLSYRLCLVIWLACFCTSWLSRFGWLVFALSCSRCVLGAVSNGAAQLPSFCAVSFMQSGLKLSACLGVRVSVSRCLLLSPPHSLAFTF